jgi:Anti-sigma factor NepR
LPHIAGQRDPVDWGTNSLKSTRDPSKQAPKKRADKRSTDDRAMGQSLRSVYQAAVEEPIPTELLDLLGKLD